MDAFTHYVYNRQWKCLTGLVLDDDATPDEVVAAYLVKSGGDLAWPVERDAETGGYWFGETTRGRAYNRCVVRALGQAWD